MSVISGLPISELPLSEPNGDDMLIVSRRNQRFSDEYGYTNYAIRYSDVMSMLSHDVKVEFGSMVSCDAEDYSRSVHGHSRYNGILDVWTNSECRGPISFNMKVGRTTYGFRDMGDMYVQYPDNYIGQLEFVWSSERFDIDIDSPDFDGWVYADGRTYVTDGFQSAKDCLFSDISSFTVPNLNGFVRCSGQELNYDNGYPPVSSYNVNLLPHSHTADVELVGTYSAGVSATTVKSSSNNGNMAYCGGGKATDGKSDKRKSLDVGMFNIRSEEIEIISAGTGYTNENTEKETYPDHDTLQVMIYVGER